MQIVQFNLFSFRTIQSCLCISASACIFLINVAPILSEPVLSWAVIVDAKPLTATSQAGDISANGIIAPSFFLFLFLPVLARSVCSTDYPDPAFLWENGTTDKLCVLVPAWLASSAYSARMLFV